MQHVKRKNRKKEKMFDKKEKNMIIPPCHVELVETSASFGCAINRSLDSLRSLEMTRKKTSVR